MFFSCIGEENRLLLIHLLLLHTSYYSCACACWFLYLYIFNDFLCLRKPFGDVFLNLNFGRESNLFEDGFLSEVRQCPRSSYKVCEELIVMVLEMVFLNTKYFNCFQKFDILEFNELSPGCAAI